jgi:processive 1,2-diacylglycerol beta-glucosyltransferase
MAIGRPLCILQPIPGQETANADFLLERGAAIKVNRLEDLPFRLEQLLGSKKLAQMAKAAAAIGHPDAAHNICQAVLARVSSSA